MSPSPSLDLFEKNGANSRQVMRTFHENIGHRGFRLAEDLWDPLLEPAFGHFQS